MSGVTFCSIIKSLAPLAPLSSLEDPCLPNTSLGTVSALRPQELPENTLPLCCLVQASLPGNVLSRTPAICRVPSVKSQPGPQGSPSAKTSEFAVLVQLSLPSPETCDKVPSLASRLGLLFYFQLRLQTGLNLGGLRACEEWSMFRQLFTSTSGTVD